MAERVVVCRLGWSASRARDEAHEVAAGRPRYGTDEVSTAGPIEPDGAEPPRDRGFAPSCLGPALDIAAAAESDPH